MVFPFFLFWCFRFRPTALSLTTRTPLDWLAEHSKFVIRQLARVNAHIDKRYNPIHTCLFSRVPRAIVGLSFD